MKSLVTFYILCLSINTIAQDSQSNKNLPFLNLDINLGDSLDKFAAKLTCIDANKDTIFYPKSYRYNNTKNENLIIGDIEFDFLVLSIDSNKKVDNISFMSSYYKKDSINHKKLFKEDFKNLNNYFTTLFGSKGKIKVLPKLIYDKSNQAFVFWRKDDIVIVIDKTKINRKDLNFYAVLNITVGKFNTDWWAWLNK